MFCCKRKIILQSGFDNRKEQSRFRVVAATLARHAVRLYFTNISKRCIRKYSTEINRDGNCYELVFVPVCLQRTICLITSHRTFMDAVTIGWTLENGVQISLYGYHGPKEHNARHGNRLVILKLWQTEWGFHFFSKRRHDILF